MDESEKRVAIEIMIGEYVGTAIGSSVQNMMDNGTSIDSTYEYIEDLGY